MVGVSIDVTRQMDSKVATVGKKGTIIATREMAEDGRRTRTSQYS